MPICNYCYFDAECNNLCRAEKNKLGLYKGRAIETPSFGPKYYMWAKKMNELIDSGISKKDAFTQANKIYEQEREMNEIEGNDVQENRGKYFFSCTGETYPDWFHVSIDTVNASGVNDGKGSVFSIATDEKEVFIDIINSDIRPIGSYAALEKRYRIVVDILCGIICFLLVVVVVSLSIPN